MEKVFEAINGVFSFIGPLSDFLWEFPTNFDWYSSIPILGNISFAIILLLGSGIFFSFKDIIVKIGPVDEDFKEGGLQFIDEVKGGNIPKEFIPSVQKGFTSAMKNGVLAGYPLDSMKVTLIDGSFHPVDSDQLSFEICAIQAYKNACAKAGPVLMEPIMKLEVVTPEENMGDVIGDLNKRRGQVEGMESSRSGARIVKAMVPLAEMFGYVTALRTITSGRATSSMVYSHHAQVSNSIAKAVLEEVKGRADLL